MMMMMMMMRMRMRNSRRANRSERDNFFVFSVSVVCLWGLGPEALGNSSSTVPVVMKKSEDLCASFVVVLV